MDSNVKMWDLRQKVCINTFKAHSQEITCLDISPDCKIIASGSLDGSVKFWDTFANRLLKSINVASTGYHPVCLAYSPSDLCIAIGITNKTVKYFELTDFTQVSSSLIESCVPRSIQFYESEIGVVGYDDGIKSFNFDDQGITRLTF